MMLLLRWGFFGLLPTGGGTGNELFGGGHYVYMADLLELERCVLQEPRAIPPSLEAVVTPLWLTCQSCGCTWMWSLPVSSCVVSSRVFGSGSSMGTILAPAPNIIHYPPSNTHSQLTNTSPRSARPGGLSGLCYSLLRGSK